MDAEMFITSTVATYAFLSILWCVKYCRIVFTPYNVLFSVIFFMFAVGQIFALATHSFSSLHFIVDNIILITAVTGNIYRSAERCNKCAGSLKEVVNVTKLNKFKGIRIKNDTISVQSKRDKNS